MAPDQIAEWKWNQHMNRPVEEALSEVEREIQVRKRCYDRWVAEGRVSYVDARDRQERLLSALAFLRTYQDLSSLFPSGADLCKLMRRFVDDQAACPAATFIDITTDQSAAAS